MVDGIAAGMTDDVVYGRTRGGFVSVTFCKTKSRKHLQRGLFALISWCSVQIADVVKSLLDVVVADFKG